MSRKQIEIACKEVTTNLLEDDSKVSYIVKKECEQILRSKLANFQEYLELPEYIQLVSLLEKGIAIHHSGLIPIFREIVEILFMKGYIKLLFATETISVGINTPTKTVIFTDVRKFDGATNRMLFPHEFVQASGRAGRRGIDTVGHVIHLNLIDIDDQDYAIFCKKSMAQNDITEQLGGIYQQYATAEQELQKISDSLDHLRTPKITVERYIEATNLRKTAINKKRKELDKEIDQLVNQYKFLEQDKLIVSKYNAQYQELTLIQDQYQNAENFMLIQIKTVLQFLESSGFIIKNPENPEKYNLTVLGNMAAHLREIHCLTFARLLFSNNLNNLSAVQLASVFSCFTNVTVADDLASVIPNARDGTVKTMVLQIKQRFEEYQNFELGNRLETGVDYTMHYDLLEYIAEWSAAESAPECKLILQKLEANKGIFLGEFIKAILKINNISSEMEKIAESIGNMELLSKLKEIPVKTLKFVATNQSLYV